MCAAGKPADKCGSPQRSPAATDEDGA